MSVEYYHLTPVVLDDNMYISFGGRTGTSTASQRDAAYQASEQMMIRELRSFLIPTTVTGTWEFNNFFPKRYRLPFFHVQSIDAVTILSQQSLCSCTITEKDGCAFIVDNLYGVIDVRQLVSTGSACGCNLGCPYQVKVAFTSGLPTGVAADDASLHLALTIIAELFLLEIIDPKALEGGPGDPGVQEWVSMGYGEKRTKLMKTIFGSSARANRAKTLVKHLTPKMAGKLGR